MRHELETAFRNTRYRVRAPVSELLLYVDRPAPELARLLHETGKGCAALITAFNPDGRRSSPFRNRRSQQLLRNELRQLGYTMLEGCNEDPRGRWPVEPSLLVLGLSLPHGRAIAAHHGQVAFLWSDASGTPRLIIQTAAAPSRKT